MKITPEILAELKKEEEHWKSKEVESFKKYETFMKDPIFKPYFDARNDWLEAENKRKEISVLISSLEKHEA